MFIFVFVMKGAKIVNYNSIVELTTNFLSLGTTLELKISIVDLLKDFATGFGGLYVESTIERPWVRILVPRALVVFMSTRRLNSLGFESRFLG